ncbi:uncharacterized protein LOC130712159 [Lotus japonicus]|uniref:uncharacterized protein LOC130712159 n=1 Tax=Lotus japonicus TaxID=34305 RepID=UPI00258D00B5|nr:uncharacterized protein LOC130712159 [Lotus japonicus]
MEGLKVSKSKLTVYLHPSKSKQVSESVLRELSSMLFTFSDTFDGVVLAYNVKSLDPCSKIIPGITPYFGVKLKVDLLLFSPKPDTFLEGKVLKVTPESIHAVVLGFSSVVITDKEIRDEFIYRKKRGKDTFVSKLNKRHVIKVGAMIRFSVKSFDEEILHVYGSLIPDNTGSMHWLDKNLEDDSHTDRSAKKRGSEEQPIMLEQDAVDGESLTLESVQKLKKSKRHKIREES